jgi:hypothetical protein
MILAKGAWVDVLGKMLQVYNITWCHKPEEIDVNLHCHENLIPCFCIKVCFLGDGGESKG